MVEQQVVESSGVKKPYPAGPRCTVCDHPQREAIDKLLAAGSFSRRTIANQFGLNDGAIQRHKTNHLGQRIAKAAAKREEKAADRFMDHVEFLMDESRQYVSDAHGAVKVQLVGKETYERFRDVGAMGPAIQAAAKVGELYGNATGRLQQASGSARGLSVVVIMPRGQELPGGPVIDCQAIEQPQPLVVDNKPADED